MPKRWIDAEESALAEVRRKLKKEISESPQFPEGNDLIF